MGTNVRKRKGAHSNITVGSLILLLVTFLALPATGGQFEEAVGAYERGDFATAFQSMKPFAEEGNAEAQCTLGDMYAIGQGVPQDYAEAVKWYRKAAEQGDGLGQLNLGIMYAKGMGVPKDYILAHMWYTLSISYPMPDVDMKIYSLGYREEIASKMTPAQITEAERLAREWKPKMEEK